MQKRNVQTVSSVDGDGCGQYALAQAQVLLHACLSAWPRRGRSVALVGCGAESVPELFWGAGFDVTGVETDARLFSLAAERAGAQADMRRGSLCALPFDDGFFDYAVVMDLPGAKPYAEPFVDRAQEACRIARRGVLLAFMNAWSLYGLAVRCSRLFSGKAWRRVHVPQHWGGLVHTLRCAGFRGKASAASTLFGPARTWRGDGVGRVFNRRISSLPWGAFMVGRLDFTSSPTFTALLVPAAGQKTPVQAAAGPISSASCQDVQNRNVSNRDTDGASGLAERL